MRELAASGTRRTLAGAVGDAFSHQRPRLRRLVGAHSETDVRQETARSWGNTGTRLWRMVQGVRHRAPSVRIGHLVISHQREYCWRVQHLSLPPAITAGNSRRRASRWKWRWRAA